MQRYIDNALKIFIIAEAGVNHNGNVELAKKMVMVAKKAGADAVKFQTFVPENLVSHGTKKADYQIETTGSDESQLRMLKKLSLSFCEFSELKAFCDKSGIIFMSAPFDLESIEFLETLDMPYWKIPSGEITNVPYLIRIARTGKPIVLSTGMSNMDEIVFAVDLLKKHGAGEISLLHCNTEYPTPFEDVNLRVMKTLRATFKCPVGYSDHTIGIEAAVAAVAMGAEIIEKHFTLDKSMEGPDHIASLEPEELATMVDAIRNIEKALGQEEKFPTESEKKNMAIARKSIVAKRAIAKGEIFTEENIMTKRPGTGISSTEWFNILGQTAGRSYLPDELIQK